MFNFIDLQPLIFFVKKKKILIIKMIEYLIIKLKKKFSDSYLKKITLINLLKKKYQ